MVKKFTTITLTLLTILFSFAPHASAEGGIYASGGGTKTAGETFTVNVTASGATFDSLQGIISVSGPVTIVSFDSGNGTWLPGKSPSNGNQFVGIVSERSSLTVATIKLKGKSQGSGSVSVSGARLAYKGQVVGTGSGGASFTINKAPELPGAVKVTSQSHPNQEEVYEAKTIQLSWEKAKGVTGFSYLIDQTDNTTPPAKATSANTSVTYENKEIGTHYFHIRAQNGDGWGGTTHFKITIKEPDPKIDEALPKPTGISITKDATFKNDVKNGTLTGIKITGQTLPGYTANLIFSPTPILPEGYSGETPFSVITNEQGYFEKMLDFPVKAGFYKLTVQGQLVKTLTPISDEQVFEISIKSGGSVKLITESDSFEPSPTPPPTTWDKIKELLNDRNFQFGGGGFILFIVASAISYWFVKRRREF